MFYYKTPDVCKDLFIKVNLESGTKLIFKVASISETHNRLGSQVRLLSKEICINKVDRDDKCLQVKNLGSVIATTGEYRDKITSVSALFGLKELYALDVNAGFVFVRLYNQSNKFKAEQTIKAYKAAHPNCAMVNIFPQVPSFKSDLR